MPVGNRLSRDAITIAAVLAALLGCKRLSGKSDDSKPAAAASAGKPAAPAPATASASGVKPPPDKVIPVGETADLDGMKMTVTEVKECRFKNAGANKPDEKFIGALVVYEGNFKPHGVEASARFKAKDAEGITYVRRGTGGTDCKPALRGRWIDYGDKIKGWVGFRVPATTKTLVAEYTHKTPPRRGIRPVEQKVKFRLLPRKK